MMEKPCAFQNLHLQTIKENDNDVNSKPQEEQLTLNEAIDKIMPRANLKLFLLLLSAIATTFNSALITSNTALTGHIPYNSWQCVSDLCHSLFDNASSAGLEIDFFSQQTLCDNGLVAGTDFNWTSRKTTFTTDWNIYCKDEAKLSAISSVYFMGAIAGLLCSTAIFDRLGRKRGAIFGGVLATLATAACSVVPNYEIFLVIRIISGFGLFISYTGSYCWIIEFAPTRFRNLTNGCISLGWIISDLMMVLLGYLIDKWQHLYMALTGVSLFSLAMFFITPLPESPRFHLVRGMESEAKRTLVSLSKISGFHLNSDTLKLIYEERAQDYWVQIKDFKKYPTMLRRSLLSMLAWFLVSIVTYAYLFGWGKIGSDIYSSYLFGAIGGGLGYALAIPACRILGRKRATLFFFATVVLMNGLAMLDVDLSDTWNIEHVGSLLGSVGIYAAFSILYLYSGELTPTTHRGMVMCLCSSSARVGSFIGPYVSLLYGVTDRRVPLALFAGLSVCGCVVVLFLPDTTGKSIPDTPKDVEIEH